MKKIIALALMAVLSLGVFVACSDGLPAGTTELVFYRARSNNMADGAYDEGGTRAIEQKFYEGTGNQIKLTIHM